MMKSFSNFLFSTLRGRLIISVALVHAIMMSLFIVDLTTRQRDMLLDRQTEEATALSQALATSSAGWIAADDVAGLQELVNTQSLYPEIVFVYLTNKEGRVLAGTDKPRQGQFMLDLPHEARQTIVSRSSSLVDVAVPAMIAGQHVGWARVGIGQNSASTKLAEIVRNGILYALAAIFIGSVIAWFMGSQITRRLYAIQETIASVRSGNRLARTALTGNDEAAVMAHEFNSMLDNLAKRDAELSESETKLQTIFARSLDAIGVSKEGIHIFVNPAYVTIFGYESADGLIGTPIINLIAPESREMVIKNVQARTQGLPAPSDYEVIALRKDGSTFIMDVRVSTYVLQDEQYSLVILRDITERKRVEEALRNSELKYRSLIEASSDAIFCVDEKGQYQFTNQLFASTFGKSPDDFIGKTFWDIYPKELADYRFEATKRVFQTGESESLEVEVPLPDKNLFFYATANPIKDKTGKALLVLTHAVNITNLKNVEAALRKSEERFKALADTSPLAIYASVGIEQKATYVNPTFVKLFGYTLEEIPSVKLWWPLAYPDENYRHQIENEWQRRVAQAIETHSEIEPMEVVVNCKDGSQRNILWGFKTLEEDNWAFGLDLTERKKAEEELSKNEERYRTLLQTALDGFWLADVKGNLLQVNESYCRMSGYTEQELLTMGINDLDAVETAAATASHIKTVITKGEDRFETKHRKKDGSFFDVEVNVQFKDIEGGRVIVFLHDITKRKQAEIVMHESLDLLLNTFNKSPLMKSLSDLSTGKYLEVNDSFCRASEFSREEVIGKTSIEIGWIGNDERARMTQKMLQDGSVNGMELHLRSKNGKNIIVRYWGTVIHTAQGDRLFSTAEDITERKKTEEKIHRQINYITTLQDIDRTIASEIGMYPSLTALISKAVSVLSVDAAAILLINFNTGTLDFFTGKGFRTEAITTARLKLKEGYASKAINEKRIVKFPNPKEKEDLFFLKFLEEEKFITYYGVPLIIKGRSIGVLEVYQRSPVKRDQEWLDFLNALAGQAAVAVDNAQLFENLQHSNLELTLAYDATIEGWSRAMDLRDRETEGHTQRVSTLTVQLAQQMGIPQTDILNFRRGALLHDIGKMGVSDNILRKPDPLTEEEWKEMRLHPLYAYEMLAPISYLKPALDIPYCHHEKWDGSGYPRGLKGEQIPLAARIFAIADVYDAVTSDRPYRKAWSREKALKYIREQSGLHFDPQIVEKFLE